MALVDLKSDLTWYGTPPSVNYLSDKESGATGFTDSVNATQYIGVANDSYTYPVTVRGGRLMQPKSATKFPAAQNFFSDVNATGFTENMWKPGQSKKPSQFVGINGDTYTYPLNLVDKFNDLNIVDDSYNTTYIQQPYVVRGLQRKGEANSKPQYWGFGSKSGFDDGFIRGGAVTVADRAAADTKRIAKFLASPKGLLWITKQIGLGLSNPNVERSPFSTLLGIQQTKVHTGVASLLSVPGTPLGLHFTRHGIPFINSVASYESIQNFKREIWNSPVGGNRLINLRNQVFGQVLRLPTFAATALGIKNPEIKTPPIQTGSPIPILSSPFAGVGGPNSLYGIGGTIIRRSTTPVSEKSKYAINRQYASAINRYSQEKSTTVLDTNGFKTVEGVDKNAFSIRDVYEAESVSNLNVSNTPTSVTPGIPNTTPNPFNRKPDISRGVNDTTIESFNDGNNSIRNYIALAYDKIPTKSKNGSVANDFRTDIVKTATADQKKFLGRTKFDDYYTNHNLQEKYGFGDLGKVGADRTNPDSFGKTSSGADITGADYKNGANPLLDNNSGFRGDKVNAINILPTVNNQENPYPSGTKDLIKFFFEDGIRGNDVMIFRAILTGLTDSFSPGWEKIDIMGRPDGAYIYASYERTVSFNFTVAAMSRGEMIPIWRKLNHLSTYTMPNLTTSNDVAGRISGPFMRMTLGDMYSRVPGFISSLSYTVPDESSWDIAEQNNGKQLPMIVEVAVSYTIIGDARPQLRGKSYSMNDWLQN